MDKFQKIVWDATYAVTILGNPDARDFELVEAGLSEERVQALQARSFQFLGVIGIVNGAPRVALATPLDPEALSALTQAFVQRIEDAINKVEKAMTGDSAEWLEKLWALPDTRGEVN